MILGVAFLACFHFSVSISSRCLTFEDSPRRMYDFCSPIAIDNPPISVSSLATLGLQEAIALCMLNDYEDFFPMDIPAVSNAAESEGIFVDGTFPDKLQHVDSQVRHRIILTYPNAVINERQYLYPQKHLNLWRTLLDQHVNAGQLRRSSSQYALPRMIIPKKDPLALPR
jgi:hypothetical protein